MSANSLYSEATAWAERSAPAAFAHLDASHEHARPRRSRWLYRRALRPISVALDTFALVLLTALICASAGVDLIHAPVSHALPVLLIPIAGVLGVDLAGGHIFRYAGTLWGHLARVALGGGAALGAVTGLVFLAGVDPIVASRIALLSLIALVGLHANYLGAARVLTRSGRLSDNVVIVGATQAAARIVERNGRERDFNILGYFDDRIERAPDTLGEARFLGGTNDLVTWQGLSGVDRIIVTVTSTAQARVRDLLDRLRGLPQEVVLVLDLEGFAPESTGIARIGDQPAAYISGAPRLIRRAIIKRCADVVISVCVGLVALPFLAIIAGLIKLDSKGPVFFRQKRHGFNNQIIRVWKFRTMRPDAAAEEGIIRQAVADDDRITRIGGFLRRTSLDEVPQLLNVLAGDMSLVGPRPHAIGMRAGELEVFRIVEDYAHRHRVKPGITGWAQINGSRGPIHTHAEVRERVRLDQDYIRRASLWFDLYILVMTLPRLLGDRDVVR